MRTGNEQLVSVGRQIKIKYGTVIEHCGIPDKLLECQRTQIKQLKSDVCCNEEVVLVVSDHFGDRLVIAIILCCFRMHPVVSNTFCLGIPQTKSITHYRVHPETAKDYGDHETITKVVAYDENHLLVATDVGLQLFDLRTLTFEKLVRDPAVLYNSSVLDFDLSADRNQLFVASSHGSYRVKLASGELEPFVDNPKLSDSLSARRVESIHFDAARNWLWMLTSNTGIDVIDQSNYEVTHF